MPDCRSSCPFYVDFSACPGGIQTNTLYEANSRTKKEDNTMRLLKVMLATVLILDAALVCSTTANFAGAPQQTVGFSTESNIYPQMASLR